MNKVTPLSIAVCVVIGFILALVIYSVALGQEVPAKLKPIRIPQELGGSVQVIPAEEAPKKPPVWAT